MDQLLKEIEAAKNTNNKLVLIIGTPGSGKSKLIHEYSKESGTPILNLDNIFKDNSTDSNIDMLAFLKELANKIVVVATWNGKIENDKLTHIRSKLPTDLTYSLTNENIKFIQK